MLRTSLTCNLCAFSNTHYYSEYQLSHIVKLQYHSTESPDTQLGAQLGHRSGQHEAPVHVFRHISPAYLSFSCQADRSPVTRVLKFEVASQRKTSYTS